MKIVQHNWVPVKSGAGLPTVAYECASSGYRKDETCTNCGARVDRENVFPTVGVLVLFPDIDTAYNNGLGPLIEMVMEANDSPA